MSNSITCPKCSFQFEPNELIRKEVQKELQVKMLDWQKQKQGEMETQLSQERNRYRQETELQIRKTLQEDFENRMRLLEQNNRDNEEKLKAARQKELEFLQREQEMKNKEAELELSVQRRLQEERSKLSDEIRKMEEEKSVNRDREYQLKLREMEKQLDDQKKLAEEMRRKAEQGSMQLQGEVQELVLEELLKSSFPFDQISEVGKGVKGADCIQTVRNKMAQECGRIIFESKRTNNFSNEWIEKLKADMRSQQADIAVLVTQALPRDLSGFGERDGIWICSFKDVVPIVHLIREGLIRVQAVARNQENKGDKMHLLYNYLTSTEFSEQWKAISEGFLSMKMSIQKERDAMERLWKSREKQLEKILLNAAHIKGSVEGIAGQETVNLNLISESHEDLMLD